MLWYSFPRVTQALEDGRYKWDKQIVPLLLKGYQIIFISLQITSSLEVKIGFLWCMLFKRAYSFFLNIIKTCSSLNRVDFTLKLLFRTIIILFQAVKCLVFSERITRSSLCRLQIDTGSASCIQSSTHQRLSHPYQSSNVEVLCHRLKSSCHLYHQGHAWRQRKLQRGQFMYRILSGSVTGTFKATQQQQLRLNLLQRNLHS